MMDSSEGILSAAASSRDARAEAIIHDLLVRIDASAEVNQRALAEELGIALGLTNTYIKRCVTKGLIKISQVPARRYRYYLTPKGFAEKSRLTAQYFASSFALFRRAQQSFDRLFAELESQGVGQVVLFGGDDLTEIAVLCSLSSAIGVVGILNLDGPPKPVRGIPGILLEEARRGDILVFAQGGGAAEAYRDLVRRAPGGRIVVPDLLAKAVASVKLEPGA